MPRVPKSLPTLKDLTEMDLAIRRKKYPSIPEHARARKKFSDKTTNDFQSAMEFYINATGEGFVWRQETEGRFRPGETYQDMFGNTKQTKGTWLKNHKKGKGDLMGTFRGRPVALESKRGSDSQSDDQKKFQKRFVAGGGIYLIVKDWEDFIVQWVKIFPLKSCRISKSL